MFKQNSRTVIAIGFAIAVALMLAITFIGISRMHSIKGQIETIVRQNNVQTELVSAMRTIARERVVNLYSMILREDPFEKDEAFQLYKSYATEFVKARDQLQGMRLSDDERKVLQESLRMIAQTSASQDQVVKLVERGDTLAAQHVLLEEVIPAQDKVFVQYSRLLEMQRNSASQSMAEADVSFRFATLFMLLSGAFAMLAVMGVTAFVVGRTREVENALFQEKELAQVTLHSIGDAVITTNERGQVDFLNHAAEVLTGRTLAEARSKPLREVFCVLDESTREQASHLASHALPDGQVVGLKKHSLLLRPDGSEALVEDSLSPICNRNGEIIGAVIVFHDVTEARHMAKQLSWQATHDALTGLVNRREFERLLQEMIDSAAGGGKHHAVLFMDLDQFKVVNDTCGHMAGDELLRQLVAVFVARSRDSDVVARLGGDEFGMLLYGCPLEPALRLANEVREAVQDFRFMWQDKSFEIGVSIGLVEISSGSGSLAAVMSNADAACYAAKEGGRNRVHVYLENDTGLARRHGEMQWISRITKAFEEDRFRLYYQEIAAVMPHQRGFQHFEVLLRMVDENGEVVPPGVFIPAAERYNLMPTVDRWVIRTLLSSRSKEWRRLWEEYEDRLDPFPILCAVNLSATSLNDEMFLTFLKEQLEYYGMPPQALCLEITETAAIANLNKASHFMHELSKLGCRFALDDFGSGMSSFAYLKDLPVHYLKIDGAFVRGMDQNLVNHAMVEAIAHIAGVMGIETVAEFVEDRALIEKLAVLGVDYAQGYGIHKPVPMEGIRYGSART
ncbi:MAG: histidine kinase [Nitrosomonadales bacterium]|nr:MAG: histidine kinase [Nitrosomonadales bacterium]